MYQFCLVEYLKLINKY